MKYLVYGDVHFCQYSSIVRSRGETYSNRLHNLINSVNWAERLAEQEGCDGIINLGDFWDRSDINAEEITAFQDIKFSSLPHTFLTGNHDANVSSLEFSTAQIFKAMNAKVITEVERVSVNDDVDFYFIPYLLEDYIEPLSNIVCGDKKKIVFSHNDIAGIQYGKFMSQSGFDIDDINKNCDLFLNGHLHNGCNIGSKIVLVGNLTGQNFNEDAFKYDHCAYVLEVEGSEISLTKYINPYAMNFYKLGIHSEKDLTQLDRLKGCAVLSITCDAEYVEEVRKRLRDNPKVFQYRFITLYGSAPAEEVVEFKVDDHLKLFIDYVQTKIESSEILTYELTQLSLS